MIEEKIEIRTTDGTTEGFLYRPQGESRWPGVVHYTDIGGIRPASEDMARRLAAQGYVVLMPNVFYRTGKPPMLDFSRKPGDERTMKRFAELSAPLTAEAIARDASAYVDFLAAHDSVSHSAMGVVGYCFGGKMAIYTAKARPSQIAAAASFHGGGLVTDNPDSPHLALPAIKARLYFGHATNDRSMPAEAIRKLDDALQAWGGEFESEVYEGAAHSWTVPDSPVYNQPQAERAFEKLESLFAQTLQSPRAKAPTG
ncbi:MAG: dienelactone hydrolase family protein [Terriglobales bacterium]